jgi:hypothetical protein
MIRQKAVRHERLAYGARGSHCAPVVQGCAPAVVVLGRFVLAGLAFLLVAEDDQFVKFVRHCCVGLEGATDLYRVELLALARPSSRISRAFPFALPEGSRGRPQHGRGGRRFPS